VGNEILDNEILDNDILDNDILGSEILSGVAAPFQQRGADVVDR
jgi:hypothetical protein